MLTRPIRVTWETDDEEIDLPEVVDVPVDMNGDEVADYLSDVTGWLVAGWEEESRCEECLGEAGGHHSWCSEEQAASEGVPSEAYKESGVEQVFRTYIVHLSGMAHMQQRQTLRARSEEEAVEKAQRRCNDYVWAYNGMDDDTVQLNVEVPPQQPGE